MTGAALEVRGVHASFTGPVGRRPVLVDVDLTVHPGEVVALVGRSGSGKTTLLTLVTGWTQPDRGTIEIAGLGAPTASARWVDVAVLPQSLGLMGELTVHENVALPLRLDATAAATVDDRVGTILRRLGLAHLGRRYPGEVSLGEQQRAALARAAVVRPTLLLADEPVSHQNREWAAVMLDVLHDLAASGTASLLATHDEVAVRAAHRVLDLADGRLGPERVPGRLS